jgi:hypothetical protein
MDSAPETIRPVQKTNKLALVSLVLELISICILLSVLLANYFQPVIFYTHGCYRNPLGLCQSKSVAIATAELLDELQSDYEILCLGGFLGTASMIIGLVSLVQITTKNDRLPLQISEGGSWMAVSAIILGTLGIMIYFFIYAGGFTTMG